jgi:hypothetical protein
MPDDNVNRYSPAECADLLKLNPPLFLVGGQAVNLWALYYHDKTYDLAPFVSRDIDILGNKTTLLEIAGKLGVEPHFFPMRPPTNEVGYIVSSNHSGKPIPIEVLTHVHGIKNEELQAPTYSMSIGDSTTTVQVPGPVALLKAKIANTADIPQEGRQDKRHVQILMCLLPAYLDDVYSSVQNFTIKERDFLNLLEKLIEVMTSDKGKRVLGESNADPRAVFDGLNPEIGTKTHSFIKKRLPKIIH